MSSHAKKIILDKSAKELFEIVIDIEQYPSYVPWCTGAKILSTTNDSITAKLHVGFNSISENYVSLVKYKKYDYIEVKQISGPFKYLNNLWCFREISTNKTEVEFVIDFAFSNMILQKISNIFFKRAVNQIGQSFLERVNQLSK